MGKHAEQNERRRIQILQIALDEFITKGYYGASTREISKIAGISSGLMFHYFESKKVLYETLVESGGMGMAFEYTETDSPIAAFEKKLTEAFQMIRSNPFAAKMFVFMGYATYNAAQISQKAGEVFKQNDIISQSILLIRKGQQLGEIRSGDPRALSIAFWCSIQGIAEEIALNPDCPIPETDWILDVLRNKEK